MILKGKMMKKLTMYKSSKLFKIISRLPTIKPRKRRKEKSKRRRRNLFFLNKNS
jgi:hypothetical protein